MVQVVPCNTVRNRGELATSCRPGIRPTILMAARSIAEGSADGPPGFASKSTESINQISLIPLFGIPKCLGSIVVDAPDWRQTKVFVLSLRRSVSCPTTHTFPAHY